MPKKSGNFGSKHDKRKRAQRSWDKGSAIGEGELIDIIECTRTERNVIIDNDSESFMATEDEHMDIEQEQASVLDSENVEESIHISREPTPTSVLTESDSVLSTDSKKRRRKGTKSVALIAKEKKTRYIQRKSVERNVLSEASGSNIDSPLTRPGSRKRNRDASISSDIASLALHTPQPSKRRSVQANMPPPSIPPSRTRRNMSMNEEQPQNQFVITDDMIPIIRRQNAHIASVADCQPGRNGEVFRQMMAHDSWLDDSYIYAYLCMLAHKSDRRITVVSPLFTNLDLAQGIRPIARDLSYNYSADTEIVLIPVHIGMHWTLLVHERNGRTFFVDSMPDHNGNFENRLYDVRYPLYDPFRLMLLLDGIRSIIPELPEDHQIEVVPVNQITIQDENDGSSCGFFVCLFAESFLENRTFLLNKLDIIRERRRILWHIRQLFESDDVQYCSRFTDIRTNADCYEGEQLQSDTMTIQPEIRRSKRIANLKSMNERQISPQINSLQSPAITEKRRRDLIKQGHLMKILRKKQRIDICDGLHYGWGCGSVLALDKDCTMSSPEQYCAGGFTKRCEHDGALLLDGENSTQCCADGKIKYELQEPPNMLIEHLKSPINEFNPQTKHFKENASLYNTLLQYASVTYHEKGSAVQRQPPVCKINGMTSHQIGPLEPGPNRQPAFQGLYIADEVAAAEYRRNILERTNMAGRDGDPLARINMDLLRRLDEIIRSENPIAKDLKKGYDYYREVVEEARAHGKEPPKVEMRLLNNRELPAIDPSIHPHRLNHTGNPLEVSAIWRSDEDGLPEFKGTKIVMHGGGLRKLEYYDPNVPPLCYPLVHPKGEQYFKQEIKLEIGETTTEENEEGIEVGDLRGTMDTNEIVAESTPYKRKFASRRQMLRHFLQLRPKSATAPADPRCDHPLWGLRKLAQKWLLDQVWTMEAAEADYIKKKVQKDKLRWELADKFIDAIKKGLKPNQTLGQVYQVPKTWKGSAAHMQQAYQKAMAIFRRRGKPTFMVTFTGNPKWKEVVDGMYEDGQITADRPDVICRVFEQYVKEARKDLEERGVLGKCIAHVEAREFQDKGCPHFHKLLTIDEESLPDGVSLNSAEFVDQYISAELPPLPTDEDFEKRPDWAQKQKRYHELVKKFMVHSCTEDSICRKDGRCSKGFPKQFSDESIISDNRPPIYRRRNNGVRIKKRAGNAMREFDNRYVVPHNRYLLERYGCHVNVEKVWGLGAGKYALKYLTKGSELAYVSVNVQNPRTNNHNAQQQPSTSANPAAPQVVDFDEFNQLFQTRFMTPQEAFTRLSSVPIIRLSETVVPLSVHKPQSEPIVFHENRVVETAQRAHIRNRNSKFSAYMELCEEDENAINLTYEQIPEQYVWHKDKMDAKGKKGIWLKEKRKRGGVIGSIYNVFPSDPELFAIRLLAIHRKGYKTFDELKSIDGVPCDNFVECARRLGLIDDIEIWRATMDEACKQMFDRRLWRFFAQLVLFSCQLHAKRLFEEFYPQMVRNSNSIHDRQRCLRYIAYIFAEANRTMSDFDLPEPDNFNSDEYLDEFFFGDDEGNRANTVGQRMYGQLNAEQRNVIDTIENAAEQIRQNPSDPNIQRLWFLDGPGGTGKTFTIETLIKRARESRDANKLRIMTTASTGIAASNMSGATTLHSAFRLPLNQGQTGTPNVRWQAMHGQRIREAEVLIIDEISMVESRLFDMVDRSCRDLESNPEKKKLPFGGKIVLIAGDWKQLLPVLKGKSIREQAMASVRSSEKYQLFKEFHLTQNMRMTEGQEAYKRFIENIGYGKNFKIVNGIETNRVEIPADIGTVYTDQELLDEVFPQNICSLANSGDRKEQAKFAQNVILSTTNQMVNNLNERILDRISGESRTYLSIDKPCAGNPLDTVYDADRQPENLNQVNNASLPLHQLRIKKGAVVILLRNLSVAHGLCNGTRMIVDEMTENIIWCRRIKSNGELEEERVAIARFNFDYDDSQDDRTGLKFNRVQFPLKLASALTINKAQGQTIPGKLGIDLSKDVFSPGMLYVALSRATDGNNVTIRTAEPILGQRPTMKNIVWDFDNPDRFSRTEPPPVQFPQVELTDDEDNAQAAFDFNVTEEVLGRLESVEPFCFGEAAGPNENAGQQNQPTIGQPFSMDFDMPGQRNEENQGVVAFSFFDNDAGSDAEGNEMDIETRQMEQMELENYGLITEHRPLTAEEYRAMEEYLNNLPDDSDSDDGMDME